MTDTDGDVHGGLERETRAPAGRLAPLVPGGQPIEALLRKAQFFTPGTPTPDYREVRRRGGRGAEEFYRERWRHDRKCARRTG
jgi:nitrate reductase alpha subunit